MKYILITNMVIAALLSGCTDAPDEAAVDPHAGHDHGAAADTAHQSTNRTPIPATVRKSLGITFAQARYRAVNKTITIPGSFELLPSGQHHYALPVAGRITIHAKLLQHIKVGDLLMEVDAPEWGTLQIDLAESEALIVQAQTTLLKSEAAYTASLDVLTLSTDEDASEDSTQQATQQAPVNMYQADIVSAQVHLRTATARFQRLLIEASLLTGLSRSQLLERDGDSAQAYWSRLHTIAIRATHDGIITDISVASHAWQAAGKDIMHSVNPQKLRFHGQALQADLGRLQEGQQVSISPPNGHTDSYSTAIKGQLRIGVSGDSDARLVDVYVDIENTGTSSWVRPQVGVMAAVTVAGSADDEVLAVPLRGVITDGLDKIIFRRDPQDPDMVLRIKADLGANDGEWVIVESGLSENDEIVIGGIYELKLATTGQKQSAGHFHSDGTFHDGED